MSVYDRPPQYYQERDITDPTPYESESPWRYDDCECPICGQGFMRNEGHLALTHLELKEDIYFHTNCLWEYFPEFAGRSALYDFLDALGFTIEEIEPADTE